VALSEPDFEPLTVVVVVGAVCVVVGVVVWVTVTPVVLAGMRFALVMVVGAAAGFPAASRAR
jgi:hypothetical protein